MNFIYKLTNLSKETGARFYIGSKTEGSMGFLRGVPTIFSNYNGLPYFGSSSNPQMSEDLKNGHVFSAEILEEVPERSNVLDVENKWIIYYNAVYGNDFYNMSHATIGGYLYNQSLTFNIFGESISQYGKNKSSLNNKNNTAKKNGFNNLGEFCLAIHDLRKTGLSWQKISEHFGYLNRVDKGKMRNYVKNYDMTKVEEEYDPANSDMIFKIRTLISEGASVKKAAEILNIEIPTACLYIGKFDDVYEREYAVAMKQMKTKDELGREITIKVLSGQGLLEISKDLSICYTSVKRYFINYVREKMILPDE